MTTSPSTEATPRAVAESRAADVDIPLWTHPEWTERFPWLLQGTTGRGEPNDQSFDFGLFGPTPVGVAMDRWRALRRTFGMESVVHSRQVHGARLYPWTDDLPPGLTIVEGYDAHSCSRSGVLLTVSIADCVPVFLVAENARTVALVHAGWRGIAAGVVEGAIAHLFATSGVEPSLLWLHCGPSICGDCYEVGPEVHAAVNPAGARHYHGAPIDLRQAVVHRAMRFGVDPDRITASTICTKCRSGEFFSHRAGSEGRQLGLLGIRPQR